MTIPPDYFELRDAAESVMAVVPRNIDEIGPVVMVPKSAILTLRKALAAGDERNGIEIVAGDKQWPFGRNIGHIAQALDGGMKETT